MGYIKRAAPHLCMVLKGMLFIGFSIQIILGICWMCCNFGRVQGFGRPDSALYGGLIGFLGARTAIIYSMQLAVAFFTGFLFLQGLHPVSAGLAVWRGLALLTVPFAMQCHLSLQPYSLMGSCFMLLLLALLKIRRKRAAVFLLAAALCGTLYVGLCGAADPDRLKAPGHSLEGALASRFVWPTLWNDFGGYDEELRTILQPVAWEASYYPDNIGLLQERLEGQVGVQAAKECYLQMAKVAWNRHASRVIRQIGWDVLGYAAIPAIFPLQMEGMGYDSYSGRNYEIMGENAPILTGIYVDYGCWWFLWMLALSALLYLFRMLGEGGGEACGNRKARRKRIACSLAICLLVSGIQIAALTMRGAGRMDYRETIAVNALWLVGPLLLVGGNRPKGRTRPEDTGGQKGR